MIEAKAGYEPRAEIAERTRRALGGDADLLERDATGDHDFLSSRLPVIREAIAGRAIRRVLDVGCGYGRHAPHLAKLGVYLGIDPNADRIDFARARHGGPGVEFLVADASFKSCGAFDLIWCSTVLQHLLTDEKLAVCRMMKAHLAPGGVIILDEAKILDLDLDACIRHYAGPDCPEHMIPMPQYLLHDIFRPWPVKQLSGLLFQIARPA